MPWPFRFWKARPADTHSAPGSDAAPRRRDWESLPPIQRGYAPLELTAPSLQFAHSLAGSEQPALSVEALGHLRSTEGPPGLVIGLASPPQTYSRSTELVGRPGRRVESLPDIGTFAEVPAASGTGSNKVPLPVDEEGRSLPIRHLVATDTELQSASPPGGLTDAAAVDLGPAPRTQRRLAGAELAAPLPDPQAPPRLPDPSAPTPALQIRSSLGQSRRRGLGAPIAAATRVAVERSTIGSAARPDFQPTASESTLDMSASAPAAAPEAASSGAELGALPLAPIRKEAAAPTVSEPGIGAGETTPVKAAPPELLGTHAAVQRSVFASRPVPSHAASLRDAPSRVAPSSVGPTTPLDLAPVISGGRSMLAGRPLPGHGQAAASSETVTVQKLRDLRPEAHSGLDHPSPVAGAVSWRMPAVGSGGGQASDSTIRTTAGRTQLVWPVPSRVDAPTSPLAEMSIAAVHRQSPTVVQRLAPGAAPGAEESPPAAASAPFSTGGSAPAAGAAPGGQSGGPAAATAPHAGEKELDDLAQNLYPHFISRLRLDLLVDRERAGMVTDLR